MPYTYLCVQQWMWFSSANFETDPEELNIYGGNKE